MGWRSVVLAHSRHSPSWWWSHCYKNEAAEWTALAVTNPSGSGTGWHSSPAPESLFLQQGSTPYSLIGSRAAPPTGNQCSNTWGCGEHSTFKRHWLPNSEKHMSVSYELPSLWYSSNINGLIQDLQLLILFFYCLLIKAFINYILSF